MYSIQYHSHLIFLLALLLALHLRLSETDSIEVVEDDDYEDFDADGGRLRWSYLPRFVEHWCYERCRRDGKPFAHLVGTRCQCLCPLNASDWQLCPPRAGIHECFQFCQRLGYRKGGDCMYNGNCFCFCGRRQHYNVSMVYTTPPSAA